MKTIYRAFLTIMLTLMGFGSALAQSEVYVVGNISGWAEPCFENSDIYEKYKMVAAGQDSYGKTIWHADFDVSALGAAPMFRFYTGLEGWNYNSYGSQELDIPIDYSVFQANDGLPVVSGKGSFNLVDWVGDHIYITLVGGMMTASSSKYVDPQPLPTMTGQGFSYLFTPIVDNPGCYSLSLDPFGGYLEDDMIDIQVAVPGYLCGEYSKTEVYINLQESLKVDEYGIAQSDFDYSYQPQTFKMSIFSSYMAKPMLYLDLNNKKIYYNKNISRWIWDKSTAPEIDFTNYKNYDAYLITSDGKTATGTFPAGERGSLIYVTPTLSHITYVIDYWDPIKRDYYWIYGLNTAITTVSWPGGYWVASWDSIGYVENFDNMYVKYLSADNSSYEITPMVKDSNDPSVFEAVVDLHPGLDRYSEFSICFTADPNNFGPSIGLKSYELLFANNNTPVVEKYSLNSRNFFIELPQYMSGGRLKIRVKPSDSTVELTSLIEDLQSFPLVKWSNNTFQTEPTTSRFNFLDFTGDDATFSIMADVSNPKYGYQVKNSIIFTDGKNLIFDIDQPFKEENGVKYYHYTLSDSQAPTEFSLVADDKNCVHSGVYNIFDKSNTLAVYNSNSSFSDFTDSNNTNVPEFFYIHAFKYDDRSEVFEENSKQLGLSRYLTSPRLNMVKADPVNKTYVYEGTFTIDKPTSEEIYLYPAVVPSSSEFYPYCGVGLYGEIFNAQITDESEYTARLDMYPSALQILYSDLADSNEYAMRVTIDKLSNVIVWIGYGEAGRNGVETVEGAEDIFRVRTNHGGISIETSKSCSVNIYSVGGMLVRSLELMPGITYLNGLSKGIYIVNGQKVVIN